MRCAQRQNFGTGIFNHTYGHNISSTNIFVSRGAEKQFPYTPFHLKKNPFSITVQIVVIKEEAEKFHFKTFLVPHPWKPHSLEGENSL